MIIRAGYGITFHCQAPTPMLLQLNVHPSREADLLSPDVVRATPNVAMEAYRDMFGNRVTRVVAPPGAVNFSNEFTIRDSGLPEETPQEAPLTPVNALPSEVPVFLLASRYSDSDNLADFAWAKIGGVGGGARLVQAICDFVYDRIRFDLPTPCGRAPASAATSPIWRWRSVAA
jgi:transglutaminase-like putative cysteine protease